jgi:DNA polymerase-1
MESRGVRLDRARVDALHAKYEEEHASNLARLQELNGGEPMAPSNDTQVRALMELNGVELTETTPSGDIAVNKRSLTRAASLVPGASDIVDVIFEARSTEKLLSTYIEAMKDRDRVHADFQQIGARTGRMSCRRPNMQNLPVRGGPEMRSMFIPDPGMSLIVADYSSIELRLLAFYMNDQRLWDIIEAGDPFAWLGEQVYGTPDQTQWKVARQQLKNGFYALTYGAGGPKLAETIGGGMTDAEGRALARKIRSVLGVNYRALNKAIEHKIKTQGYVTTLLGRRQYVPRDRTYVGLNALIQGTAAEIMKRAMLRAHDSVNGDMLLTVHDELMMQVKTAYAEQELATLCDVMKSAEDVATNGKLRLAVDGKVCHNSYAEAK